MGSLLACRADCSGHPRGQGCDIRDRRCRSLRFQHQADEGRTHDDTVGVPGHLCGLLRGGNPKADTHRLAALASGLLMTAFIVGIASVWIRGYTIDCGCFGGGGDISAEGIDAKYARDIARDFLFVGMSAWLVVRPRSLWSLDRESVNPPADADVYSEEAERQV